MRLSRPISQDRTTSLRWWALSPIGKLRHESAPGRARRSRHNPGIFLEVPRSGRLTNTDDVASTAVGPRQSRKICLFRANYSGYEAVFRILRVLIEHVGSHGDETR